MKKIAQGMIPNPGRNVRRVLRLTMEQVRVLDPAALAEVLSGCDTTSFPTQIPRGTKGC
ncbi:MAG TPA: hypothetical protein VHT91_41150 [Kofleriaceae bacterium]|jgi:hypothetical protein|nr:hypothetical protein [Kofleriaceae bacterium]